MITRTPRRSSAGSLGAPSPGTPGRLELVSERDLAAVVLGAVTDSSIIATDADGTIVLFNAGAERLTGYRADDVVGKRSPLLFHDSAEVAARAAGLGIEAGFGVFTVPARDGGSDCQEWTYVRENGTRVPVRLTVTAINGVAGVPVGYVGVAEDLAREHRAAADTADMAERFRLLVDNVQDYAILMLDPAGLVTSWNPGVERLKGYRRDEIIGRHFSVFYPEAEIRRGEPQRKLAFAAEQGRVEDEGWRVRRDGSRFWANVTITALRDADGTLRGFGKIVRDLTERRAQVEAIASRERLVTTVLSASMVVLQEHAASLEHANSELTRSNAELDAFAYTASHDLTEPLRGLHNYARFALEDYGEALGEDGRHQLETMVRLSQRMQAVVDSLLLVSRLGRTAIEPADVNLDALVATVIELNAVRIDELGVQVRVPAPLGTIRSDEAKLREILLNLVANAVKYARDSVPRWIEIRCQRHADGGLTLEVADNGIGIAPEHRTVIFDLFRRLHARDARGGGVGAGLAIVRRVAERLGGTVEVRSTVGQGSTFTVDLPRIEEPSA